MAIPTRLRSNQVNMIRERNVLVHVGLPQGAVTSPDLLNLYTSDLPNVCGDTVKCLQFADDAILYTIGEFVSLV